MGRIFMLGLLMIGSAVGLGMDYSRAAAGRPADAYTLSDHVAVRLDALKLALKTAPAPGILPAAPEGWASRPAALEDSLRATGVVQPESAMAATKALEKALYEAIPGHRRLYQTYEKGDEIVVLDVTVVPVTGEARKGRLAMGAMFRQMSAGAEPYGSFGGVDLVALRQPGLGAATVLMGQVDGIAFVSAASNADEATTRALIGGIDFAAVRQMAEEMRAAATAEGVVDEKTGPSCKQVGAAKVCSVGN